MQQQRERKRLLLESQAKSFLLSHRHVSPPCASPTLQAQEMICEFAAMRVGSCKYWPPGREISLCSAAMFSGSTWVLYLDSVHKT